MKLSENEYGSKYIKTMADLSPEFGAKKVFSLLQFYKMESKKTKLLLDNLEPMLDIPYLLYSPQEDIYYFKTFRNYPCEHLYWYRKTLTFSGDDEEIENFRRYFQDGMLWVCFDKERQVEISTMLKKVWKSNLSGEGQMDYKIFYDLLDQSLKLEDYESYGKSLTGYVTIKKQFTDRIAELWKMASEKRKS